MSVGTFSSFQAHGNVRDLFATMTARNNTSSPGAISPNFALRRLHLGQRPPFKNNSATDNYDAVLAGSGNGDSIVPIQLGYVDVNTGFPVVIGD